MKIAALFSGGKDSTYASYLASKEHELGFLVTLRSENKESYMFHTANIHLTELQSQTMGIPMISRQTEGIKEEELDDIMAVLSDLKRVENIEGVVTGAIASEYQRSRIENICKELGIKCISPLWQKDPENLLIQMLANGFDIIITAVAAEGLDETWLGRKIDAKCISDLLKLNRQHGINIMGEGGEYETTVLDCPLFGKKIEIMESEKQWDEKTRSGELFIKKVGLSEK